MQSYTQSHEVDTIITLILQENEIQEILSKLFKIIQVLILSEGAGSEHNIQTSECKFLVPPTLWVKQPMFCSSSQHHQWVACIYTF